MMRLIRPLVRPFTRQVTYARWVHLLIPVLGLAVWMYVMPDDPWVVALLLIPLGLIPAVRLAEGVQAQLLLVPLRLRGRPHSVIRAAPSVTWRDRGRTVLWLEIRLLLSTVALLAAVWAPMLTLDLISASISGGTGPAQLLTVAQSHWQYALLAPIPLLAGLGVLVGLGELIMVIAHRMLGPSPGERLTALEERTEQLLERNRIARELHDSIGHALTVAVVQAGAAREAGSPAFTERALAAIEETGRDALDDLERVLRVLRESDVPVGSRPTLAEADRLLDSARASGNDVHAELPPTLADLPAPVSREGYRILQESLTNVLRHAGPAPVRVRIEVVEGRLELAVTNPLGATAASMGGGSGLRGIRERAVLLGGSAKTGPYDGEWRVHASLPLSARA
ncbi:two-component sensor histidine kinase [Streptomyces spiroverticillatus]|uniref:histidine kinase n=1 Tax=Streptomyces finlayi TaxID=67296 RepID=A0A918WWM0_9ACTN|nr:histidine kinase [Streptomyces finlayi]GHA07233.1 two-component sensor histidine kinase [Streptomyces spiroverticillatus]GHC90659.1 two-component sensor histidine kinase [Streptomyces finlayi]